MHLLFCMDWLPPWYAGEALVIHADPVGMGLMKVVGPRQEGQVMLPQESGNWPKSEGCKEVK